MQFVRAHVAGVFACGGHRDLSDEEAFAAVACRVLLADRPPVPPHAVHLGLVPGERVDRVAGAGVGLGVRGVGQVRVLEQAERRRRCGSRRRPGPARSAVSGRTRRAPRGAPVPVGLFGGEHVQVPLAGPPVRLGHPAPGRAAEHGVPVVGRLGAVGAAAVGEVEAGAGRAAGPGGERLAEPGVLAGAVVGHDVQEHLDAEPPGGRHQQVELGEVAEERVDAAVVGHVVAVVGLRGGVEGAEPDAVHPELLEVRQPGPDAA